DYGVSRACSSAGSVVRGVVRGLFEPEGDLLPQVPDGPWPEVDRGGPAAVGAERYLLPGGWLFGGWRDRDAVVRPDAVQCVAQTGAVPAPQPQHYRYALARGAGVHHPADDLGSRV